MTRPNEGPRWIIGSKEEDNMRYRELLKYMEEKRKEDREILSQEERSQDLKEKDGAWRQRRIEECDKIREEEKRDRLAVTREKKKRYGINKISKDENLKIKRRTEERLDVAKAKENLWKRFRDGKEDKEMEDEELKAWEALKKSVVELEEEGGEWKTAGRDISSLILSEKLVIKARREDTPEVEQFCINTGE